MSHPFALFIAAYLTLRFIHRLKCAWLTILAWIAWPTALVLEFVHNPQFAGIAGGVGLTLAIIVLLPLIAFSLFFVLFAPVSRGGKPPEIF